MSKYFAPHRYHVARPAAGDNSRDKPQRFSPSNYSRPTALPPLPPTSPHGPWRGWEHLPQKTGNCGLLRRQEPPGCPAPGHLRTRRLSYPAHARRQPSKTGRDSVSGRDVRHPRWDSETHLQSPHRTNGTPLSYIPSTAQSHLQKTCRVLCRTGWSPPAPDTPSL